MLDYVLVSIFLSKTLLENHLSAMNTVVLVYTCIICACALRTTYVQMDESTPPALCLDTPVQRQKLLQ